jgi:hypothetical protein
MEKVPQVKFAVITKASLKPLENKGNWADEWAVINPEEKTMFIGADFYPNDKDKTVLPGVPFQVTVKGKTYTLERVRVPVFVEGEILILEAESGREIAGHLRKPSKWFVEYEVYDSLEEAIKAVTKLRTANHET